MDSGDAIETPTGEGPDDIDDKSDAESHHSRSSNALLVAKKAATLLPKISQQTWKPVTRTLERAVESSTTTPARMVRFALGVPVGLLLSMLIVVMLANTYPLTVPMALVFLVLPLTLSTGLVFTRVFPIKDNFTNKELSAIERAQFLLKAKTDALDAREAQMRKNGLEGPAIEAALGPERDKAQLEYFDILNDVQAKVTPKALGTGEERPPD